MRGPGREGRRVWVLRGPGREGLCRSLGEAAVAIVNGDDAYAERMVRNTKARVIRFGFGAECDYRASDYRITAQGTDFVLTTPDGLMAATVQAWSALFVICDVHF